MSCNVLPNQYPIPGLTFLPRHAPYDQRHAQQLTTARAAVRHPGLLRLFAFEIQILVATFCQKCGKISRVRHFQEFARNSRHVFSGSVEDI